MASGAASSLHASWIAAAALFVGLSLPAVVAAEAPMLPSRPTAGATQPPAPTPAAAHRPIPHDYIRNALDEMLVDPGNRWDNTLESILNSWGQDALPELIHCLDDPMPAIRATAIWTLACLGTDPQGITWWYNFIPGPVGGNPLPTSTILPQILAKANDPAAIVRREVVRQLYWMAFFQRVRLQELEGCQALITSALGDSDVTVREFANRLTALQRVPLAAVGGRVRPPVYSRVTESNALQVLLDLAEQNHGEGVQKVAVIAHDGTPGQRAEAVRALAWVGMNAGQGPVRPPDAIALPIVAALADPDAEVRVQAADAIGWWGYGTNDTAPSVSLLRPLLSDPSRFVRSRAANGLCRFRDGESLARLAQMASDISPGDRGTYLPLLCDLRFPSVEVTPQSLIALPVVLAHFDDPDWMFSRNAAMADLSPILGAANQALINPELPDNIDKLAWGPRVGSHFGYSCDDDESIRPSCLAPVMAVATGRIPGHPVAARELLRAACLRIPEPMVSILQHNPGERTMAALALASIGDKRAVPELLEALQHREDPLLHHALLRALVFVSRTRFTLPTPGMKNSFHDEVWAWPQDGSYQRIKQLLLHGTAEEVQTAFGAFWEPVGDIGSIPAADRAELLPAITRESTRQGLPPPFSILTGADK